MLAYREDKERGCHLQLPVAACWREPIVGVGSCAAGTLRETYGAGSWRSIYR